MEILEEVNISLNQLTYFKVRNNICYIKCDSDFNLSIDLKMFDVDITQEKDIIKLQTTTKIEESVFYLEGIHGSKILNLNVLEKFLNCNNVQGLIDYILEQYKILNVKMNKNVLYFFKDIYYDQNISPYEKDKIIEFINGVKFVV